MVQAELRKSPFGCCEYKTSEGKPYIIKAECVKFLIGKQRKLRNEEDIQTEGRERLDR